MTFMIFAITSVTDYSYAYWATNVSAPIDDSSTGTITVGTWSTSIPSYDPNTYYTSGDVVENNGIYYTAKKSGYLLEPGVAGGWKRDWTQN
jgi:hypothetical protein